MSVTVLGVMVPKAIVNGADGNPLPAVGWLVRLTLTEESRQSGSPTIRKRDSAKMAVWEDFEKAAQDAFTWWNPNRGNVVWALEACDDRKLPDLKGPSLGGAFALGLTLLHFRGDPDAAAMLDERTEDAVKYAYFSDVVVSARVLTPAAKPEAIELGSVGGMRWKLSGLEGRPLVVSDQQDDIDTEDGARILRVTTIKDAINRVFDLESLNILERL